MGTTDSMKAKFGTSGSLEGFHRMIYRCEQMQIEMSWYLIERDGEYFLLGFLLNKRFPGLQGISMDNIERLTKNSEEILWKELANLHSSPAEQSRAKVNR